MKYSAQLYARAFFETIKTAPEKKQEEIARRFIQVIRKNSDQQIIKKIFRQVRQLLIKNRGGRIITLEFARAVSEELRDKLKNNFSAKDYIEEVFRPELIAGVRVLVDNEKELDLTMRRNLKRIFR
jgi:F0F1-type ATP synthase delta subunit